MMLYTLENLKKYISLKWNEKIIHDSFDTDIDEDLQCYTSSYVLELQAIKTMYDYIHTPDEDGFGKDVCEKSFIIADELEAQISYHRAAYKLLRNFVDERFVQLGSLLQEQNPLTLQDSEILHNIHIWYRENANRIFYTLDNQNDKLSKSVFGLTRSTLKNYISALSNRVYSHDYLRKNYRIKQLWECLISSTNAFNNEVEEIEKIQNNFFSLQKTSYSSKSLAADYDEIIDKLGNFPKNNIAKSCCNPKRGNCVAIMEANNNKWFTLSGLDNTGVLSESNDDIYNLGQNLSMLGFSYSRLTGDVMRYTKYNNIDCTNHPFLMTPVQLSQDTDRDNQKKEYTCCERKLLASEPNAPDYKFFIKYKPCKRCLPAMAHKNITSFIYATEKGFYNQNNTIKTIHIRDLGDSYKVSEDFDIEKDY